MTVLLENGKGNNARFICIPIIDIVFISFTENALLEYESHRKKIFLRRLSGSEASSFLLGNGSSSDQRSRLDLRPVGVQGRIRELNLRARHFAETVMAVQLHDAVPDQVCNFLYIFD